MVEISVATEAFNLAEGQSQEALKRTLDYLCTHTDPAKVELLLAVTDPAHPALSPIIEQHSRLSVVDCCGMPYDKAKNTIARTAQGEILAFLDGDCVPRSRDWLDTLVAPVKAASTHYVAGRTVYEGGYFAKVCSILDFGFLYEVDDGGVAGCYASNNFAVARQRLVEQPIPEGRLRCNCFYHAQLLQDQGTPFIMATAAQVEHELPPFFKERWRRGIDFVGEPYENAKLPAARSHRSVFVSAWRIYRLNLERDRRRLAKSAMFFGFSRSQTWLAAALLPVLRLVDLTAVIFALRARRRDQPDPFAVGA